MTTVLGLDVGTQSVKAVFYDFEACQVSASASAPLDLHQTDGGVAEQRAEWWIEALRIAMASVDKRVRESVAAIAVSGQQHGFVPIDRSGEVLIPVKLWCDTSTRVECDRIVEAFGGRGACIEEVGNLILPGYTASKVRWFRDAHPDLYASMDAILLPHDYLNFYLTGERCMEAGDASGTGFLDIRTRTWSEKMLSAIDPDRDLRECLPEVRLVNGPIGTLSTPAAQEIGLTAGTPVAAGGGDNMMGAIGTRNVTPGVVTISLGTSGTVFAYSNVPVIDPEGDVAAFCSSTGGWLPLVCTMNCTVGTELVREMLGVDIAELEAQLAAARRGAGGIITVPFFNGERTPNLPQAKACITGLDTRNARPENLLRSVVEGATFALRHGLDRLIELGIDAEEVVLTGGGAKSGTWRQIVADVCAVPVTVLKNEEGAAFGAALQALAMLEGGSADIRDVTKQHLQRDVERCCDPDPAGSSFYSEAYGNYQNAVLQVAALYD
ncbi:MAG: xylulokinase [Gammaproteobacteria bacterium]|nr:xylulokinase [Gammaproteobacteria bacterium]